ncbi:MAG: alkaline shock response membrane anchor protein AmaP [Actinomycetota bacterium]|nr:alkaline shock response membrane anchor protein AmaP [Actinomycetota bacterium]
MKRLPRRSTPATLTAVVLLAACVLVAVVAIQTLLGHTPWISYSTVAEALNGARWNDEVPAIVGGGIAVLGLILLLTAIVPGKLTVLPLAGDIDSGASRRSYRSTLRAAASIVDGVADAKVNLRRRTVFAVVSTGRTNTDGLADAVRTAIEHRLDHITPAVRPKLKVKVNAARSAS